jgi:hypothetical protein
MSVPSAEDLEAQFGQIRPKDLPLQTITAVRERSKRLFGNKDRLEVAVAITRVALGKVSATDLGRDLDMAVNRIRAQLLALEALGLLAKTGDEDGKRMFQRTSDEDRVWGFAVGEYEDVIRSLEDRSRDTARTRR